MFLTFARNDEQRILNRSQFWMQINFSEALHDIQSVRLDKLIAMITVLYTMTMISKINKNCWFNCNSRVLTVPPCESYQTRFFYGNSSRGSGYRMMAMGQLLFGVLADWRLLIGVGALVETKVKGGRRRTRRRSSCECESKITVTELEGIISSNILTATNPYRIAIAACWYQNISSDLPQQQI